VTLITDFRPDFPPSAIAGLLLAARTRQAELGLPHPSVPQILEATGATRSRAYEVRDDILAELPGLVRRPGRPRSSPDAEPIDDDHAGAVTRELLRFVMEHPGCVRSGSMRRRYSDVFRHRVLDLRREHADLDLAVFAEAVAVPVGTVEDWLRAGCAEPRQGSSGEPPNSPDPTEAPDARIAIIETVLHAWRSWHGDLTGFCEHVRHHHRLPIVTRRAVRGRSRRVDPGGSSGHGEASIQAGMASARPVGLGHGSQVIDRLRDERADPTPPGSGAAPQRNTTRSPTAETIEDLARVIVSTLTRR
jgi:hypothetical protein